MTLELLANSPTPGSAVAIATLAVAVSTTPAPGTVETWTFNTAPPAALQGAGQYHFTIDSEICIDVTAGAGASRQIQRGAEGSTVATHLLGASVYHGLTAGSLLNYIATNLPTTAVKVTGGPSPGVNGYKTLPQDADYILSVVGTGVGAIAAKSGNTDYSASSGDHAAVVQSVVGNLLNPSGPTGGLGGKIAFDGHLNFTTQLILYPNIALIGGGMHGYHSASPTWNGSVITSTFNGPCILVKNDARGSTFVHLEKFLLYGSGQTSGFTGQHGIGWVEDITNGNVLDTLMLHVGVFAMGGDALNISGATGGNATKILATECYAEFCGGNGITQLHNADLWWKGGYITGHTGNGYDGSAASGGVFSIVGGNISNCAIGINALNAATEVMIGQTGISSCTSSGILIPNSVACVNIQGCTFRTNGSPTVPQLDVPVASNTSANVSILGNNFQDGRGASAVTNHIRLGTTGAVQGSVIGNLFYGHQGDAVAWTAHKFNKMFVKNNQGFNNTKGKVASPWQQYGLGIGSVGAGGPNAAPVASNAYYADGTDIMISSSGGTGVSITIADPAGNTVQSGLSTYNGVLPVGYTINFGAFSVAPTVYVGVV